MIKWARRELFFVAELIDALCKYVRLIEMNGIAAFVYGCCFFLGEDSVVLENKFRVLVCVGVAVVP